MKIKVTAILIATITVVGKPSFSHEKCSDEEIIQSYSMLAKLGKSIKYDKCAYILCNIMYCKGNSQLVKNLISVAQD